MNFRRRRFLQLAAGALTLAALSGIVQAQTYPSRPITMISPFPPGGATDSIARIIQEALAQALGQPIVIESVGGAGGMIAAARAARAANDGYTILIHTVPLAAGMTLYSKLSFDAEKDFVPIGLINTAATMLIGRPNLPPNDLKELVAWLREPGRMAKFGHAGVGSFNHLAAMLIAQELGATASQIPYRGGGPALVDLMAGQVDLELLAAVNADPQVKAGKAKGYAVIGRHRFAGAPELPTMGERGYKKLDLDFWHMLLAPVGTPRPIVDKLNAALGAALADPQVRKSFAANGMDLFAAEEQTPEAASAVLRDGRKLWGDVIRANHITGD
jgi:tripartite-type tricarboxylate transporter receptor subunit TctC